MSGILLIGLGFLGLLFGSFGSVLMMRSDGPIQRKRLASILRGRSACPHCGKILAPHELIPLISFFLQKGKCASCKTQLSILYPILEITSAIIFMGTALVFSWTKTHISTGELIFRITTNRLLLLLLIYDIRRYALSDSIWRITLIISLSTQFIGSIGNYHDAFWGSLVFGGGFWLIYQGAKIYVQKRFGHKGEGIGLGDVYLAFLLGTLIPFITQYNNITTTATSLLQLFLIFIILSSILGIVIFGLLQGIHHLTQTKKIELPFKVPAAALPFFPAMIIAFWILIIAGKNLFALAF